MTRFGPEQLGNEVGALVDRVLAGVEDEKSVALRQGRDERIALELPRGPCAVTASATISSVEQARIVEAGQVDEERGVAKAATNAAATWRASRVFPTPPGP